MKYILSIIICTVISVLLLVSCGNDSASYNNGSDTGVSRTDNDVMDNIERGIDDMADGTVFDANGEHSNVDEYQGNAVDMNNNNGTDHNHTTNNDTNSTQDFDADMSYDSSSITDSTMNY